MIKRVDRGKYVEHQRGSVIVEATVTLTLYLTLVFSLFDFGLSLFLYQTYLHEARSGARYGAVSPSDTTAIKNMVLYGATKGAGNGIMGLSPNAVTVTRAGTAGGSDDRMVVTISGYSFTLITPGWAGNKTGTPITVTIPVEN